MAASENGTRATDWAAIVAVIMLLGSAIWVSQPAENIRPPSHHRGQPTQNLQDADARLWQDPFEAVINHRKQEDKAQDCYRFMPQWGEPGTVLFKRDETCDKPPPHEPINLETLKELIQQRLQDDQQDETGTPSVVVLGILVNGGPYVGAEEDRRQVRYTVLAGLAAEGFNPEDGEHLGHLEISRAENSKDFPRFVPFEWLKSQTNQKQSVLVLWLNEDAFNSDLPAKSKDESSRQPLSRLARFMHRLQLQPEKNLVFKIIGPADSNTLLDMRREAESLSEQPLPCSRNCSGAQRLQLEFLSPWATASDQESDQGNIGKLISSKTIMCIPLNQSECLNLEIGNSYRIGANDYALAKQLADELRMRGIDNPNRVVLIGQWDTEYSRRLRHNFCDLMANLSGGRGQESDRPCFAAGIIQYEFLRGIDGKLADDKSQSDKEPLPTRPNELFTSSAAVSEYSKERAEGNSQIDYLRRITRELLKKDYQLRKDSHFAPRGIGAIGILGNDYYDKLLILSVIKPAFPEALFFTTDLDANMLNPEDNRFTRNLIVASAFGLTLQNTLQEDIPPFRISYQTATFLAIRSALRQSNHHWNKISWRPVVFEIGRTTPVDLSPQHVFNEACDSDKRPCIDYSNSPLKQELCNIDRLDFCVSPHPPAQSIIFPSKGWLLGGAIALVIIYSSVVVWRSLATPSGTPPRKFSFLIRFADTIASYPVATPWRITGFLAFIVLFLILCAILLVVADFNSEPFFWIQGVSIWPSELIRLATAVVSLLFIVYMEHRLEQSDLDLSHEFFGLSLKQFEQDCLKEPFSPFHWYRDMIIKAMGRKAKDVPTVASSAWQAYLREKVLLPAVIYACMLFGICLLFMLAWGLPTAPASGPINRGIDLVLSLLTAFLFLVVLFYVSNATSRITKLVHNLGVKSEWGLAELHKYGLLEDVKTANGLDIPFQDWLNIHLIARCTQDIKRFIFFPIVVLTLMLLARNRLFDAWTIPWQLLGVYGVSLLIAIFSALRLRRAAEAMRTEGLQQLNTSLQRAKAQTCVCMKEKNDNDTQAAITSNKWDYDKVASQLEHLIESIKNLDVGAFAPFTRQASVQAILAIMASLSSLKLLDYFQIG